jgi:hypothetical protein
VLSTSRFHVNLLILMLEPKISKRLLTAVIHFNLGHNPTIFSYNVRPVVTPISL